MKAKDPKVISILNSVLANELTAINQYFLHSRMFKNWGIDRLAAHEYEESIDEMKHADTLIERILFLEGVPNVQKLGKVNIGVTPVEVLTCDLALEMDAIPVLRDGIAFLESNSDYITREILERILESEEEHVDWLETQFDLIERLGEANYLSEQMRGDAA